MAVDTVPGTVPGTVPDIYIFSATWCPACKRYVPHWKAQFERQGKTVEVIDVDKNPALAKKYGITQVPTVIRITKSGDAEVVPPSVLKYLYYVTKALVNIFL